MEEQIGEIDSIDQITKRNDYDLREDSYIEEDEEDIYIQDY